MMRLTNAFASKEGHFAPSLLDEIERDEELISRRASVVRSPSPTPSPGGPLSGSSLTVQVKDRSDASGKNTQVLGSFDWSSNSPSPTASISLTGTAMPQSMRELAGRTRQSISGASGKSGAHHPPPAPAFPLDFVELPEFEGEPLPVRLGLAPPANPFTGPRSDWYLCAPPPEDALQRRMAKEAAAAVAAAAATASSSRGGSGTLPRSSSSGSNLNRLPSRRGRHPSNETGRRPSQDLTPYMSLIPGSSSASTSTYTLDSTTKKFRPSRPNTIDSVTSGSDGYAMRRDSPWGSTQQWQPEDYFRYEEVYSRGKKRWRKWHGYDARKAPWYYSYDQEVLQGDQFLHAANHSALQRPAAYPFQAGAEPARVLDVGCGCGVWSIETAKEWKKSEIIGMDLVPIQTPINLLNDDDLSQRVSWVVANMLEEWPFPDNSFDFVFMRCIDSAVPESMWDHVLSEAVRVSAPGAIIEVCTANLPFFGNPFLLPASDLAAMAQGQQLKRPDLAARISLDEKHPLQQPAYDALKVVYAKMDNRRCVA